MKKAITAVILLITVITNVFVFAADIAASSIKISISGNVMEIGETRKIIAEVNPLDAEVQFEYISNNPDVIMAAVGTVIAKSEGMATITVKIKGTELQDSVDITVVKKGQNSGSTDEKKEDTEGTVIKVSKITVRSKTLYLDKYETGQISCTVSPGNANNTKLLFKSSNTSVATVDEKGYVYAKKIGNTTITVSSEDGNATASVKVYVTDEEDEKEYDSTVRNINITYDGNTAKDKYEVMTTETIHFSTKVSPSSASKKVTWRSSDKKIATVDSNGKVTGIKKGTCTIYATSTVNSSRRDSITIVVTEYVKYPDSIKVIPPENAVYETGNSVQFTVSISPDYTTERRLIWEVQGGATVSQTGLVNIIDGGEIKVYAYSSDRKTVGEYKFDAKYSKNHFEYVGSTYNLTDTRAIELYFDCDVNQTSAVLGIFASRNETGNGEKVDVVVRVSGKKITVSPAESWPDGDVYLFIKGTVCDVQGNSLMRNYKYKLNIRGGRNVE